MKPIAYSAPTLYVGDVGIVTAPATLGIPLAALLGHVEQEHFVAVAMDRRMRVLECGVMSIGSDCMSIVDQKGIMRWALTRSRPVYGIVVAHNHPSGDTTPSEHDKRVTCSLGATCKAVGFVLHDHLIVAGDAWFSFASAGIL
jgi:DNA repair protein RadC